MGDLRNKAKKDAAEWADGERKRRRENGFTVFHFDFSPKLTWRDLTFGEAVRLLQRATGTKVSFWRCPVRGLALQYKELPRTSFSYDQGTTYRRMTFSTNADAVAANASSSRTF